MIWYQVWKCGKQIGCHRFLTSARRSAQLAGGMVVKVQEPVFCSTHELIHPCPLTTTIASQPGEEETLP
jgi:hypothetical protein